MILELDRITITLVLDYFESLFCSFCAQLCSKQHCPGSPGPLPIEMLFHKF